MKQLWLLSDNSKFYQNIFLPVIVPFIGRRDIIAVRDFIHLETQQERGVGVYHLAVVMRHVNRYIRKTCNDVSNSAQLTTALSNDGGLANSTVELVCFKRKGEILRP